MTTNDTFFDEKFLVKFKLTLIKIQNDVDRNRLASSFIEIITSHGIELIHKIPMRTLKLQKHTIFLLMPICFI